MQQLAPVLGSSSLMAPVLHRSVGGGSLEDAYLERRLVAAEQKHSPLISATTCSFIIRRR